MNNETNCGLLMWHDLIGTSRLAYKRTLGTLLTICLKWIIKYLFRDLSLPLITPFSTQCLGENKKQEEEKKPREEETRRRNKKKKKQENSRESLPKQKISSFEAFKG